MEMKLKMKLTDTEAKRFFKVKPEMDEEDGEMPKKRDTEMALKFRKSLMPNGKSWARRASQLKRG